MRKLYLAFTAAALLAGLAVPRAQAAVVVAPSDWIGTRTAESGGPLV